jgi:hypothetical protein
VDDPDAMRAGRPIVSRSRADERLLLASELAYLVDDVIAVDLATDEGRADLADLGGQIGHVGNALASLADPA